MGITRGKSDEVDSDRIEQYGEEKIEKLEQEAVTLKFDRLCCF